jgi:hypothetical protein
MSTPRFFSIRLPYWKPWEDSFTVDNI